MSVHEETPAPRKQPNKAAWLNSPDAPQKPNVAEHKAKVSELVAQRRALIAEVKELQSSMQKDPATVARDEERNACRQRLSDIDAKRHVLRERRAAQDAEIAKLRKKRGEIAESLRNVQAEVGGFKNVKEIDDAKEYVMRKMESSSGGLQGEKRNQVLLNKLEQAKGQLSQLQPLTEAMKEVADQETVLQQEYLAISEQIGIHNKEYDEEMQKKRALDKEAQHSNAGRSDIYKQRMEINSKINDISQTIDSMSVKFQKAMSEYDTWYREARDKYFAKQAEQREQRRREYEERINAHKIAKKQARAVKRQNPYVMEISACGTLIHYLKQKKVMLLQDEEERKKREAAAHFDPSQVAPAGFVVLNEGKWSDNKPLSKTAKKQQRQQQKQQEKASAVKVNANDAPQPAAEAKDRLLQHPEDKIRFFQMIEVEPALSLATIDEKVHQIEEKKKQYEQHIQTGELVLSSGDDEEAEEAEEAQAEAGQPGEGEPAATSAIAASNNEDTVAAAAAPANAEKTA
ncbi:putative mitochondrial hypothetical protein [Leptomonas pyrrhocoris]|uniref:Nuclear segregation protein n=1 Tax=Leptomonas pyrrhocoris TaxID=157538 RepID=A0A0M9G7Z9_LEPPY|nr:putative mitochondrial hypothetical protein [Leptomonas pyrrhocoris]XP_015662916.1 putative mitochondrial hypothetical protein [Leptomonas pyrrhocoris]KPA84476.1 putative mitochondrial hypothetical protein [Leptomonas pyrrhocoris]KPA84477.1 putative mitochondrial hypothetical protein [Leptomonas pyrrhocoris]|eukprot:XP_015662915.1 putative mitochondrial hypothetical protein [Leptomonas pyrrhocoris]